MNVNSKHYDFSLTGSEISDIKTTLSLALALSWPGSDYTSDDFNKLRQLLFDNSGNPTSSYKFVDEFICML